MLFQFLKCLLVYSFICTSAVSEAGFLEDFYTSAGSNVNLTPAQIYQTQNLGIVTGGGLVWRTPQTSFQPFYFSPPSLKAGCGGIDVFLGSFGLANKTQFIQFLRSIGQNATGLAFKVALQALAPEIESKIQEIASYINDWNKHFGNACAQAKALMDAGGSAWIKEKVQEAKLNLVSRGVVSDYSEANDKADTSGDISLSNATTQTNSANKTIQAPEINVLWAAFNGGDMGLSQAEKELMMALVGTIVVRKNGTGADTTLAVQNYPSLINLTQLLGDPFNVSESIPVYSCQADTDICLQPVLSQRHEKTFANLVYSKAKALRDAILLRQAPNQEDLKLLTLATSIPIYQIIQLTTLRTYSALNEFLLQQYALAVAWEMAARYIEHLAHQIEKMLTNARQQDQSQMMVQALDKLYQKTYQIRLEMKHHRDEIYQQINKNGALLSQLEQIERALYSYAPAQLAKRSHR
ncbi:MAG: conjugal transfer protein TraH [Gammaproteobacteria bacterium]|nr:conjugal transfer protein TraH [Gammaproteobacteria bacterium]